MVFYTRHYGISLLSNFYYFDLLRLIFFLQMTHHHDNVVLRLEWISHMLRDIGGNADVVELSVDLLHKCWTSALRSRAAAAAAMNSAASDDVDNDVSMLSMTATSDDEETLDTSFRLAWRNFLRDQDGVADTQLLLATPMRHLAETLAELERHCQQQRQLATAAAAASLVLERQIPGYLSHRGAPNLIVCSSQREQIAVVLSIYAHTARAPLPGTDELLYCDADTSGEQVEIFMRNAFRSPAAHRKCHTIMNMQA